MASLLDDEPPMFSTFLLKMTLCMHLGRSSGTTSYETWCNTVCDGLGGDTPEEAYQEANYSGVDTCVDNKLDDLYG